MYKRTLHTVIESVLPTGRAIVVMGPRQVGKTTLIKSILSGQDYLFLNADDPVVKARLTHVNTAELRSIIGKYRVVFIDEAQRIPGIGLTLKLITDEFPDVQLFVSGSSSFDLAGTVSEPLTGRKWEYVLYPVSWEEYEDKHGYLFAEQQLENRLLYGFYPEVLNHPGEERMYLEELVNSYLYRDILAYGEIRKPDLLEKLLEALALQVGSEVSYHELAQLCGIDQKTVQKYIALLEKGFVIFRLRSYSRNLRNEIKRNRKIYFYDNGIRNAVIGNFTDLNLRQDKGALWENFLISERLKQNQYKQTYAKMFFWRTKQQQEVDLVELKDGKITGFEFKWKAKPHTRLSRTFLKNYQAEEKIIDRSNFREFVVL